MIFSHRNALLQSNPIQLALGNRDGLRETRTLPRCQLWDGWQGRCPWGWQVQRYHNVRPDSAHHPEHSSQTTQTVQQDLLFFKKKNICHLHSIVKPTASPHVLDSKQTRSQLEISDLRPRYKFHCLETTADQNTVLERILFVYRNLPRNSSRDFSSRCDASLLISSFIRKTAFLSRDLGS